MIFTSDLSAQSKVPEGLPRLDWRLSSEIGSRGRRRLDLLHAAVPLVPLVLLSLVDGLTERTSSFWCKQ